MSEAKEAKAAQAAKPAKAAQATKPAKAAQAAKPAKAAKAVGTLGVLLAVGLFVTACATNITRTPILSEGSGGDTVVAYATNVKLGLGTKEATSIGSYKLSATGGLDITGLDQQTDSATTLLAAIQLGTQLAAAKTGIPIAGDSIKASLAPGLSTASVTSTTVQDAASALPSESVVASAAALSAKMKEAKASGKPLVVVAGNTGCSYCARMDKLLDADTNFTGRTDIVIYRETSPWTTNQAAKWTGGGNFPVLRVSQWDASGAMVCDKKVNRPQSVADIEAALSACSSSQ